MFPVSVLQGTLLNPGAALISDRKIPNALGEEKYGSSKGLGSCNLGWPVATY